MKNYNSFFFTILFFLILTSCSKDEPEINVPPASVSNINAEVTSGTLVLLTWDAAKDDNGDPVKYDVIINEKIVKQSLLSTSIEIDVEEFAETFNRKAGKNGVKDFSLSKAGLSIVLGIEIRAYDDNNSFSTGTAIKNIEINRAPGSFEFLNIYFDTYNYNDFNVEWSSSSDDDGDELTYNIYLNNILMEENYLIQDGSDYGRVYIYYDFSSLADDEMTLKIVASDGSNLTEEISEVFDFNATDVDLGVIEIPNEQTLEYTILSTEPDDKVAFKFSITEETGYLFENSTGNSFYLRDSNRNSINSGYNSIQGGNLSVGEYYIEFNNNSYNTTDLNGTLSIKFGDPTLTDVDLGILEISSETVFDYDLSNELDSKIVYSFEITEKTGYVFTSDIYYANFTLYDENENYINYTSNSILKGEELSVGKYELVLSSSYYNTSETATLTMNFKDADETDVQLGSLEVPSTTETEVTLEDSEPDDIIKYYFTIDEITGYTIYLSSNSNKYLYLRDANGNTLDSGNNTIKGATLTPGTYSVDVSKGYYSNTSSTENLTILLKDPKETDQDLGTLTLPHNTNNSFELENEEPDSELAFKFVITESTSSYTFSAPSNVRLELKDINLNRLNYNTQSITGTILTPGTYYVVLSPYYSSNDIAGVLVSSINN